MGVDWERRIHEGIEAYNRGEFAQVLDLATDDVELKRAPGAPESPQVLKGRDQVLEFFVPDVWEEQRLELLGVETLADCVLVELVFRARGAGSGIPVELNSHLIYRIAGDKVTRIEIYNDEAEARAATGRES